MIIIRLSFSLDRLESSVTYSHFYFHQWSLKSSVEVEQYVIMCLIVGHG